MSITSFFRTMSLPKFALIWLLLLTVTAFTSVGWLQPDEHARVLEPAHFIAYGFASLPWEFDSPEPIVSWFLGAILSPLFFVTKFFEVSGTTEAALARLAVGLLASTRLLAMKEIFTHLKLR
ncbi:MAG: hypothetical protein NTV34_07365, partial [Proteobacteria bacterium]|nr:hypothetical protein [Pseudomonadota bacterium]